MSAATFYTIRAGTGLMIKSFEGVQKKLRTLSKSVITLANYTCIRGIIAYVFKYFSQIIK